jgi:tetratricopeptide (TPR) repeat protein
LVRAKRSAEAERLAKNDAEKKRELAEKAGDAERVAKVEAVNERANAVKAAAAEKAANEQAQKRLTQIQKANGVLASIFADLNVRQQKTGGEPLGALLSKRLVQAAGQLEGDAVGDPSVVAGLQQLLGRSLLNLGHPQDAIPLFARALEIRTAGAGSDHPDTLNSMRSLAEAYVAVHKPDLAVPLFEESLKHRRAKLV